MYRVTLLVFALALSAVAQQKDLYKAAPGPSPDLMKAPQPGHPLDPGDVYVLTGKADEEKRQQRYSRPQVYYGVPTGGYFSGGNFGDSYFGGSMFGNSSFGTGAFGTSLFGSRRSNFGFGSFGGNNFLVFGGPRDRLSLSPSAFGRGPGWFGPTPGPFFFSRPQRQFTLGGRLRF